MDKKPSLVFFGNEVLATGCSTSAPVLRAFLASGYDIKALVLSRTKVTSRSQAEPTVVKIAHENNVPVIDDLAAASRLEADAGVLAAYGQILSDSVLNAYPVGIINIHPS